MNDKFSLAENEFAYYIAASMIVDFNVTLRTAADRMNIYYSTLWRWIRMDSIIPNRSFDRKETSLKMWNPELAEMCRDILKYRALHHGFRPIQDRLLDSGDPKFADYLHIKLEEFRLIQYENRRDRTMKYYERSCSKC